MEPSSFYGFAFLCPDTAAKRGIPVRVAAWLEPAWSVMAASARYPPARAFPKSPLAAVAKSRRRGLRL